jgi:sporulation protein YlmC with PRC-barrel domain
MDVVHDVLDKSVVDRNGREMGRVDGIVLETGDGPPRITALLIGPAALGSRLHPALGRFAKTIEQYAGVDRGRPAEIRVEDVDRIDRRVRLRLSVGETAVDAIEQWLRRWIVKLPGHQ